MAAFKKVLTNADGWSDWIYPNMDGYRMACCDCGLVHNLQFKVVKTDCGEWVEESHAVGMRASRNSRSTAQVRRHRKRQ